VFVGYVDAGDFVIAEGEEHGLDRGALAPCGWEPHEVLVVLPAQVEGDESSSVAVIVLR
jgi:hypothetical protein